MEGESDKLVNQSISTLKHTLFISMSVHTLIGCGPKREAAEDKIRVLEQQSQSQLTLTLYPKQNEEHKQDNDLPYYLLTQKLETGETLIWKNEALNRR